MTDAVILQTAFLGDVVLTTPLLAALALRHGPVDAVTTPEAAPLLATHPAVREVIPFDKRGAMRGVGGAIRLADTLRRRGYGIAYLPQGSVRTALIARLAGIPRRVGFDDAPGRWWYTERRSRQGHHECERLLSLAGCQGETRPALNLTADDRRAVTEALAAAGVRGRFAVVAPGSARATKRWPRFAELAGQLARTRPVVVVGTPDDRLDLPLTHGGVRLPEEPAFPVIDLAGCLTIRQSAAAIALADVVVANDSAALHLAQAAGTPVIAIFGPTVPAQGFGPRGPRDQTVELKGLACRPCGPHGGARCPLGHHRCMRELSLDAVVAAVEQVSPTAARRQATA